MPVKNAWVPELWWIFVVSLLSIWLWNAVQFVSCDFEANYKCEVIHGIGTVIPPFSLLTVWFPGD